MRSYMYLLKLFFVSLAVYISHAFFNDLNIVPMILTVAIIALYYYKYSDDNMMATYRLNTFCISHFTYCIFLGLLLLVFIVGYTGLIELMAYKSLVKKSLDAILEVDLFAIQILLFSLIIPAYEEFLFRGVIQKLLRQKLPATIAVICQALMYSLYHLNVIELIPALALGLVTGFIVYYTNSLWSGIITHAVNNLLMIVLGNIITSASTVYNDFIFFIMMVVSGVAIIYMLSKLLEHKNREHHQTLPTQDNHSNQTNNYVSSI